MANTPFLDLVKPAGTDRALVSVINSNSDKIDGGVSTLSEQIAMNALGTKTTVAALESALATLGGSMPNNSVRNVMFAIDPAQGVFKNANYTGTISRSVSGRYTVSVQSHSSVQSGGLVVGVYANSAWSWQQLAPYEKGTFTAHIYDYNTKIAEITGCSYTKIGNIYVMWYIGAIAETLNISTMLQMRNFPCSNVLGGNVYAAGVTGNFGDRTVQGNAIGLYLRPNYAGSLHANVFTFMVIGAD